uniref:Uncharacterized protein n=2 Tax=Oryza sativa subsp. japonica TaxID=39947 RepID=Q10E78_ORYSJ|nr:hypothetical protein [Oryza sativa Japonica Group]ABF98456.1 hypothetical protein LOC_Os03g49820 [Oryza sativa Japonica Group]
METTREWKYEMPSCVAVPVAAIDDGGCIRAHDSTDAPDERHRGNRGRGGAADWCTTGTGCSLARGTCTACSLTRSAATAPSRQAPYIGYGSTAAAATACVHGSRSIRLFGGGEELDSVDKAGVEIARQLVQHILGGWGGGRHAAAGRQEQMRHEARGGEAAAVEACRCAAESIASERAAAHDGAPEPPERPVELRQLRLPERLDVGGLPPPEPPPRDVAQPRHLHLGLVRRPPQRLGLAVVDVGDGRLAAAAEDGVVDEG